MAIEITSTTTTTTNNTHLTNLATQPNSVVFNQFANTYRSLLNKPLFDGVPDKDQFLREIFQYSSHSDFKQEYERFLKNLCQEDWYQSYLKSDPKLLSALSFIAFFKGAINEEELSVINTLAEAIQEKTYGKTNEDGVKEIFVGTLTSSNVEEFLGANNFPPYCKEDPQYKIVNKRRSEKEEQELKEKFKKSLSARSPVERTYVKYALNSYSNKDMYDTSVEHEISKDFNVGFTRDYGVLQCTLLPLDIIFDLIHISFANELIDRSVHKRMFGHEEKSGPLYQGGRHFSIPCVFLKSVQVHHYKKGPRKLGMEAHDKLYHIWIEANISAPNIRIIIKIVNMIKSRKHLMSDNQELTKTVNGIVRILIDREAISFIKEKPHVALVNFVALAIFLRGYAYFKGINGEKIVDWTREHIDPIIVKVMQEEGLSQQTEVDLKRQSEQKERVSTTSGSVTNSITTTSETRDLNKNPLQVSDLVAEFIRLRKVQSSSNSNKTPKDTFDKLDTILFEYIINDKDLSIWINTRDHEALRVWLKNPDNIEIVINFLKNKLKAKKFDRVKKTQQDDNDLTKKFDYFENTQKNYNDLTKNFDHVDLTKNFDHVDLTKNFDYVKETQPDEFDNFNSKSYFNFKNTDKYNYLQHPF